MRTFVGRIELLAPWMRQQLVTEMRSGDFNALLGRRGRFLDGFPAQIHRRGRVPGTTAWVQAKTWAGTRRFLSEYAWPFIT